MITGNNISDIQFQLLNARKKIEDKEKKLGRTIEVNVCDVIQFDGEVIPPFCGAYEVEGSNQFYSVMIGLNEQKNIFVACTCRGALEHKGCYHSAKAFDKHLEINKDK